MWEELKSKQTQLEEQILQLIAERRAYLPLAGQPLVDTHGDGMPESNNRHGVSMGARTALKQV
jgi:hypothetical protein